MAQSVDFSCWRCRPLPFKIGVELCPLFAPFRAQIGPVLAVSERTGAKSEARSNSLEKSDLPWKVWRRGSGSNRRIKVLQTSPLPLGYRASPWNLGKLVFRKPEYRLERRLQRTG